MYHDTEGSLLYSEDTLLRFLILISLKIAITIIVISRSLRSRACQTLEQGPKHISCSDSIDPIIVFNPSDRSGILTNEVFMLSPCVSSNEWFQRNTVVRSSTICYQEEYWEMTICNINIYDNTSVTVSNSFVLLPWSEVHLMEGRMSAPKTPALVHCADILPIKRCEHRQ
jgi:hypothetical protein